MPETTKQSPKPPNARLRVFELPTSIDPVSDKAVSPFLLVFDRCSREQAERLKGAASDFAKMSGARGVLVFQDEIDLEYV